MTTQTPHQVDDKSLRENKYPECLFLDLKIFEQYQQPDQLLALQLTINFNEEWLEIPLGRIKIGLRGGELHLNIKNGSAPFIKRAFIQELPISVIKEVTISENKELGLSPEVSWLDKVFGVKLNAFQNLKQGKVETAEVIQCQISTKGPDESPKWAFRLKRSDEQVLLGLIHEKLCDVRVNNSPCLIEGLFKVSLRDVWITDAEGIWPPDISSNKLALVKREIVFWWLKSRVQPYLSKITLPLLSNNLIQGSEGSV